MPIDKMFDNVFPSKWLRATDLDTEKTTVVTVKDVTYEPVGPDQEMRVVYYFTEIPDKGLVLTKTNAMTLAALYGNDPNSAIGKKIGLFVTEVTYAGRVVDAIRVSSKVPQTFRPQAALEPEEQVGPENY